MLLTNPTRSRLWRKREIFLIKSIQLNLNFSSTSSLLYSDEADKTSFVDENQRSKNTNSTWFFPPSHDGNFALAFRSYVAFIFSKTANISSFAEHSSLPVSLCHFSRHLPFSNKWKMISWSWMKEIYLNGSLLRRHSKLRLSSKSYHYGVQFHFAFMSFLLIVREREGLWIYIDVFPVPSTMLCT